MKHEKELFRKRVFDRAVYLGRGCIGQVAPPCKERRATHIQIRKLNRGGRGHARNNVQGNLH